MASLRVLVPVKRVLDYAGRLRVKADKSGMETKDVKLVTNPFDEVALEEAIRLKEKGHVKEIIAVTLGPATFQEGLRTALALGADKAIHVETDAPLEPLAVAKLLKEVIKKENNPELVITGKQAVDDDTNATAQLLAGMMGWSQATFASKVEIAAKDKAVVSRDIDGGVETLEVALPAVVSADLRLNVARFAKLPNIMKARKMPITKFTPAELGVDIEPHLKILSVEEPPARKAGVKVKDVKELVSKLKADGLL